MNQKKAKKLRRLILKENENKSTYFTTNDGSIMIDGAVRKYKDAKHGITQNGRPTK